MIKEWVIIQIDDPTESSDYQVMYDNYSKYGIRYTKMLYRWIKTDVLKAGDIGYIGYWSLLFDPRGV